VRRIGLLLVGLAFLIVPGQALAALQITSPQSSAAVRSNQSLTVAWTGDGDTAANGDHLSYLLFTGAFWSVRIDLNHDAIAAHSLVFAPNDTIATFRASHSDVQAVSTTPASADSIMLPPDTYAIDLYVLDGTGGTFARASAVQLSIQDRCAPGTYSADGWPPCTLAEPGHYVFNGGATSETPCDPGMFAAEAGDFECHDAPPGSYIDVPGATEALLCDFGTYQPRGGQRTCVDSPPNAYVDTRGATTYSDCPAGATSPPASTSADACISDAMASHGKTPCSVAKHHVITAACVARQLGIGRTRSVRLRLGLSRRVQVACAMRGHRIIGTAPGACRVRLVVARHGVKTRTYRAVVTIHA
jgi:hypothetical protein